jgi:hypothetical protein
MRNPRWWLIWFAVLGLLSLVWVGNASASSGPIPPVIEPRIVAVSSSAICPVIPCSVTATLTYNVGVGFTPNAARDFTIVDLTQRQVCVTQSLTPSPIVVGGTNLLLLNATCAVSQGDRMALLYREDPTTGAYVFNLSQPRIHALSPQRFAWIQGTVVGCPPVCSTGQ